MNLIKTYPIAIPFLAILLAEITKAVIDAASRRKKIRFINPGGMPSGHSAFVSALVTVTAYREGMGSTMFTISAVLALIVMYDAINLRREVGRHAKMLNKLKPGADMEESAGHTFFEVAVGACFGAFVAFLLLNF